nr:hypothetical protein [Mesorhizobium loti]
MFPSRPRLPRQAPCSPFSVSADVAVRGALIDGMVTQPHARRQEA